MAETSQKLQVQKDDKGRGVAQRSDWPSFSDLRREMDSMFEDFTRDMFRFPARTRQGDNDAMSRWSNRFSMQPAVDVVEKDDTYRITAELPGMEQKNVDVRIAGNVLTIKGEKSDTKEEDVRGTHVSERRYGMFERSFSLPDGVDQDKIEATISNGVLTLTLPKSEQARAREKKIQIKSG
jgi:HSP20 family protein